jgi:Flp pilus assembly pilin Flp
LIVVIDPGTPSDLVKICSGARERQASKTPQPHPARATARVPERQLESINMEWITGNCLSARAWPKGQTMTEYALILSAVAVVVYIGYQTMGGDITSLLSAVGGKL